MFQSREEKSPKMPNLWSPLLTTLPAVLLLAALFSGVRAQGPVMSPAPMPPPLDCTTPLLNLSNCLTYVETGSNLTVPDKGCCPGLVGLISSYPICLCQLLSSGEAYGLQFDRAKALKLPAVCHVNTPPLSLCAVLGFPVASPMSPSPAPMYGGPSPSTGGPSASTGGLAVPGSTPSIAPSSSHGSSSFRVSGIVLLICLSWSIVILAVL